MTPLCLRSHPDLWVSMCFKAARWDLIVEMRFSSLYKSRFLLCRVILLRFCPGDELHPFPLPPSPFRIRRGHGARLSRSWKAAASMQPAREQTRRHLASRGTGSLALRGVIGFPPPLLLFPPQNPEEIIGKERCESLPGAGEENIKGPSSPLHSQLPGW